MLLRSNAHTHTTFCDGKNSVEEMAQAAIARNFVSLGFSIHGWTPYEVVPVTLEKEALYRAEVRRVREKYADQLEIILGVERDALYEGRGYDDYEYVIDSTHWFIENGAYCCADYSEERMLSYVRDVFGGDFYAYTRAYYRQAARMCSRSDALFIGHIDLITKFNEGNRFFDEGDPRYLSAAKEAIDCAIARGKPLEMNTGAIGRGYRTTPYPNPALLKFIHDEGGEILINSDCHSAASIDAGFELCAELARAAGFDHVLRLRRAGLESVGLSD